jgi:hypothetical protein
MSGNGRVYIPSLNTQDQFKLYDKIEQKNTSFREALTGNWKENELSCQFFSTENIRILNNSIIDGVREKSKNRFNIGTQDQDELKIIMRAIYLENAKNLLTNIPEQVESLNKLVLQYSIPQILSSLESYAKYMHDITNMYTPMDRPVFSNVDDKTIEFKRWF